MDFDGYDVDQACSTHFPEKIVSSEVVLRTSPSGRSTAIYHAHVRRDRAILNGPFGRELSWVNTAWLISTKRVRSLSCPRATKSVFMHRKTGPKRRRPAYAVDCEFGSSSALRCAAHAVKRKPRLCLSPTSLACCFAAVSGLSSPGFLTQAVDRGKIAQSPYLVGFCGLQLRDAMRQVHSHRQESSPESRRCRAAAAASLSLLVAAGLAMARPSVAAARTPAMVRVLVATSAASALMEAALTGFEPYGQPPQKPSGSIDRIDPGFPLALWRCCFGFARMTAAAPSF